MEGGGHMQGNCRATEVTARVWVTVRIGRKGAKRQLHFPGALPTRNPFKGRGEVCETVRGLHHGKIHKIMKEGNPAIHRF